MNGFSCNHKSQLKRKRDNWVRICLVQPFQRVKIDDIFAKWITENAVNEIFSVLVTIFSAAHISLIRLCTEKVTIVSREECTSSNSKSSRIDFLIFGSQLVTVVYITYRVLCNPSLQYHIFYLSTNECRYHKNLITSKPFTIFKIFPKAS